jgi:hypothetical protein
MLQMRGSGFCKNPGRVLGSDAGAQRSGAPLPAPPKGDLKEWLEKPIGTR